MRPVSQKREVGMLDGTPDKRVYWSIISDYDLTTGICELVDNAIDLWMQSPSEVHLRVELRFDVDRQLVQIKDNAGGVRAADLRLLVAPGASSNDPDRRTIGVFGVGSKRAVVALAENVSIRTRYRGQRESYQIDISNDWLESDDWDIPHYAIPAIADGVTIVDLSAIRRPFSQAEVRKLETHLGETYSWFINTGHCDVLVNDKPVTPRGFDVWAFPPTYEPRTSRFTVDMQGGEPVDVEITCGLIRDRDPASENYGVYFYCNHRLIVKELKTREVGYFVGSEAGVPHPDASLCRAIVRIDGPARQMPWNSSKSNLNFDHPIFQQLRPTLIQLLTHFSSLSRRFKDDWEKKVFEHSAGTLQPVEQADPIRRNRLLLPPLPRVNKRYVEVLKDNNKKQLRQQPWTVGLVEAMGAVDIIQRQNLETKNRIALILLDSNFEIGLKEFIVHNPQLFPAKTYNISELFGRRPRVIDAVAGKIQIDPALLDQARHYYELRNKLIHERATVDILDSDVENYRETVQEILSQLFKLHFE